MRCEDCYATLVRAHDAKADTGVETVVSAWNTRAAESSLSRIKAETIEECARVAENPGFIGAQDTDWDLGVNFAKTFIASAIRSLGSTGGGDAEEGSTQKDGSR